MKIRALIDCNGIGYESLAAGETREVSKEVGELLVSFGYAESEEAEPTPEPVAEPTPKKSKKETQED